MKNLQWPREEEAKGGGGGGRPVNSINIVYY